MRRDTGIYLPLSTSVQRSHPHSSCSFCFLSFNSSNAVTQYHKRCCSDKATIHDGNKINTEGREAMKSPVLAKYANIGVLAKYMNSGSAVLSIEFETWCIWKVHKYWRTCQIHE